MKESLSSDNILEFWILIGRTVDSLRKGRQKELAKYGITREQAGVLQTIHDLGGTAKSSEISRYLFRERISSHQLLERMERAGFLMNVEDPERKNGVKFALTERGREAYHQLAGRGLARKVLSSFTKKQYNELMLSLQLVLENTQKEIGSEENIPFRPPVSEENQSVEM